MGDKIELPINGVKGAVRRGGRDAALAKRNFDALACHMVGPQSMPWQKRSGRKMRSEKPYTLCVDVGGPTKIGWADIDGREGTGVDLGEALDRLASLLVAGRSVALGFEAPIWTPMREDLARITGRRGGVETAYNRAWSAGAGSGALGAGLALMPWCLSRISKIAGPVPTSVDLQHFIEHGGLFLWEAFVSAKLKVVGTSHHDDARLACDAFVARWPDILSDIPAEPALNHAVSSAMAAGMAIDQNELGKPSLVVAVTLKTAADSTSEFQ